MNTPIIRPSHAVYIWEENNVLHIELPNTQKPDGHPHYLRLPNNVWGMHQLVAILAARTSESRIGEKGDQTQHQAYREIRDLMKGIDPSKFMPKPKATPEQRSLVRDIMRRIGI